MQRRKVKNGLKRKGFEIAPNRNGRHIIFIYHNTAGKKTDIFTMVSHGKSGHDIQKGIISTMARQCNLTRADFLDLINCTMSQEEYENLMCEENRL